MKLGELFDLVAELRQYAHAMDFDPDGIKTQELLLTAANAIKELMEKLPQ